MAAALTFVSYSRDHNAQHIVDGDLTLVTLLLNVPVVAPSIACDMTSGFFLRSCTRCEPQPELFYGRAAAAWLKSIEAPKAERIGYYAFYQCSSLQLIDFRSVKTLGAGAFRECTSLHLVHLPEATSIESDAFHKCSNVSTIIAPKVTWLMDRVFALCEALISADFSSASFLGAEVFNGCVPFSLLLNSPSTFTFRPVTYNSVDYYDTFNASTGSITLYLGPNQYNKRSGNTWGSWTKLSNSQVTNAARFAEEKAVFEVIRKSDLTVVIESKDHSCDDILRGIVTGVDFNLHHFDDAIRAAAQSLKNVFDHYGHINTRNYEDQTALTSDLTRELFRGLQGGR
ncbi:MAG: leucine-rich repeat domain-containing protein [Odoribacteraceae bacterium]|jgi:hypothetical protein|nr:leucine-rich repeat domain-containing protein [Odoribacteraceae bacterium]